MKEEIVRLLRLAIEEVESGRARGCFVACFGPEPDDKFSISACEPAIRDIVIEEAKEMLEDIKGKHMMNMN
jgi:hypothetical protein